MADFDLIQTDAQVQSILNDGQNMQGAGAQTTLTTESVLLKDVNGNYHKILKSSFTEAIRDTLAGLLVNNDKGTTINQIAAIANGDFGSITPANLASVLGGVYGNSFYLQTDAGIQNCATVTLPADSLANEALCSSFDIIFIRYNTAGVGERYAVICTKTRTRIFVLNNTNEYTVPNIQFWRNGNTLKIIPTYAGPFVFIPHRTSGGKTSLPTCVNSKDIDTTDYTQVTPILSNDYIKRGKFLTLENLQHNPGIMYATGRLNHGEDLNTILTPGTYFTDSADQTNNLVNKPTLTTSYNARILVMMNTGSVSTGYYGWQFFLCGNQMFMRFVEASVPKKWKTIV